MCKAGWNPKEKLVNCVNCLKPLLVNYYCRVSTLTTRSDFRGVHASSISVAKRFHCCDNVTQIYMCIYISSFSHTGFTGFFQQLVVFQFCCFLDTKFFYKLILIFVCYLALSDSSSKGTVSSLLSVLFQ